MVRKASPVGAMELRQRSRRMPRGGLERQLRERIVATQRCVCRMGRKHVCLEKEQGVGSGKKRDKDQAGTCQSR